MSHYRWYSSVGKEAQDFAHRKERLQDDIAAGKSFYPLLDDVTPAPALRLNSFRQKWDSVPLKESDTELVTVRGRITKLRRSSKGLVFMDISQDGTKVQVVLKSHLMTNLSKPEFEAATEIFRRGDIISATGYAGRTPAGELSLIGDRPSVLLTPCLHPLPTNQSQDVAKRVQNRVVDLAANPESREMIQARATVIRYIRNFFSDEGFLEVDTPILSDLAGGASARPFATMSNHLAKKSRKQIDIALRIAPELWLKRLVIGGFDKVFEVGPSFRNESIDSTHNPEFTTCEFYWGYATLNDLTTILEEFFTGLLTTVIQKHPNYKERLEPWLKEFEKGIEHVDFLNTIAAKTKVPTPSDLNDVGAIVEIYNKMGLKPPHPLSPAKLWDELSAHFVENHTNKPMLVVNQPELMAPLAKSQTRDGHQLSKRFELFINGMEYANGYEEENSPFAQMDKFIHQQRSRTDHNDDEAHVQDKQYVEDMEWGLPPTAGCGIGVDRLCMFITGAKTIQQVMPFAGLKLAKGEAKEERGEEKK